MSALHVWEFRRRWLLSLITVTALTWGGVGLVTAQDETPAAASPTATEQPATEQPTAEPPATEKPAVETPPAAEGNQPAADATPPAAEPSPAAETPATADTPSTTEPPAATDTPTTTDAPPATETPAAAEATPTTDVPADAPAAEEVPPTETPAAEKTPAEAGGAAEPNDEAGRNRVYMLVAVSVLTIVVPIAVGLYLANFLRSPEYGFRLSLVFLAIAVAVVINTLGWPPKLGIDLSGGIQLYYEINRESLREEGISGDVDKELVDKLVRAVTRRVNPGGVKEVTVLPYGNNEIEITIPEADDQELNSIKRIISSAGALEFRILANRRDHADLIDRAEKTEGNTVVRSRDGVEEPLGYWVPIRATAVNNYAGRPEYVTRQGTRYGQPVTQILVAKDRYDVTGAYLQSARAGFDQNGRPSVAFTFDFAGSRKFGDLTGDNLPIPEQNFARELGIILDGELYSAPSIRGRITDRGEITGNFTQDEVSDLAAVLTAGQLPAALNKEPSTERVTGPTLGADMIRKGVFAMMISTIAVVVFMVIYYGPFAGTVANAAVLLNVALVVAFMIMLNARFTLAGLAGMALTVGMSVDANVLIYERIREELSRGATLRMAIRNGFDRATITIVDANVTTLITAIVLFAIGTEQVKGFAVTLILGILMNMFTAITCSRTVFELAERKRLLKKLSMLQLLSGTKFDFIGKRHLALAAAALVIAAGMFGVFGRGKGLLDIDFTGGVSVEIQFEPDQRQDIAEVRRAVADLRDSTVQAVQMTDELPGMRYLIKTSEAEPELVEEELRRAFGDKLATNHMTVEKVAAIPAAERGEFAGGSVAELSFSERISHANLEIVLDATLNPDGQQSLVRYDLTNDEYIEGSTARFNKWTLRMAAPVERTEAVLAAAEARLAEMPFFPSSSKIGAAVAGNTQAQAAYAILGSLVLILAYVWFRFKQVSFGFAAIAALVHDVLVTLGALALSYWLALLPGMSFLLIDPFKIDLAIVAAFLTIIGYSLNDTIVIFDRIREIRGKSTAITADLINTSVNQTLSRTLITSITTLIVVVILYVFGGQGIHGFAFALVVGTLSGTYSTIFVAAPMLLWLSQGKTATAAGRVKLGGEDLGAATAGS